MPDRNELERIAAAMHALRPEWNPRSLLTFLERNHAARAYRDLAIAAITVATDTRTKTPQLLNEHGPWWTAAQTASGDTSGPVHYERCPEPGHTSFPAHNCSACRAEQLAPADEQQQAPAPERPDTPRDTPPSAGPDLVRAAMATHGIPTADQVRARQAAQATEARPIETPTTTEPMEDQ